VGVRRSEGVEYSPPPLMNNIIQSPTDVLQGIVREAVVTFQQDLTYIKDGSFKEPYDMSPRHRQWSPFFVADQGLRLFREAAGVFRRQAESADTRTWMDSGNHIYPEYYRHTFHYQTDGWLSSDSAQVYETATENLFAGRQDAMQRTSLVHIGKHIRNMGANERGEGVRILEVACGTGRVMTFVRDNWPSIQATVSDLSPFYLEEARKNHAYWEDNFAPQEFARASFVQANAERLPFEDGSFDIMLSVFLFHELPREAQDAVMAEAARVLAPGGVFVLTDSNQLGDIPYYDGVMGNFRKLAEPYYEAYIRRDLAALARKHGLDPKDKEVNSRTKSLSFVKPLP
jgi:ubiquinone/menaquinone biosynthesis C-methylase UbiE